MTHGDERVIRPLLGFVVPGEPIPQGSLRAFVLPGKAPGTHRAIVTSDNSKTMPWRRTIATAALADMRERSVTMLRRPAAIRVECLFYFARPKSVKVTERHKTTRPDCDKLARSLLDGLTGTVYEDDAQVTQLLCFKFFGATPRAEIRIYTLEGFTEPPA